MKQFTRFLVTGLTAVLLSPALLACKCAILPELTTPGQLTDYDFIAHVKITGEGNYKEPDEKDYNTIGLLSIKVLELFKGTAVDSLLEYSKFSSCDLGIEKGEEWILFVRIVDGKPGVYSCGRSVQYKDADGLRNWKYGRGIDDLEKLRELFNHPELAFTNGYRKEVYPNGQTELLENYVNGKREGNRTLWYPNGQLYGREYYSNGLRDGKSTWFYPSGEVLTEDYFTQGKPCNVSRYYFDPQFYNPYDNEYITHEYPSADSAYLSIKKVQVHMEKIYNGEGRLMIWRQFYRVGKIYQEHIYGDDEESYTSVFYYKNGNIHAIQYFRQGRNYGRYQEYTPEGKPKRSWYYDEQGNKIASSVKQHE